MRNHSLVEALQQRQGTLSQTEFARELGITQGNLSRIYSGSRAIGLDVASKIVSRYPEMKGLVIDVLFGTIPEMDESAVASV